MEKVRELEAKDREIVSKDQEIAQQRGRFQQLQNEIEVSDPARIIITGMFDILNV